MVRFLVLFTVVALGVIMLPMATTQAAAKLSAVLLQPYDPYRMCAYVGDPHLVPFSQQYNQYACRKSGWELLLSNQYVTLYVLVDQDPYNIIDVSNCACSLSRLFIVDIDFSSTC